MKTIRRFAAVAVMVSAVAMVRGQESQWVHAGADGKLVYKTTERGDRIMDFSYAGYMGGGVALPDVPTRVTVKPAGNGADDSDAIQKAVDEVSALGLENGFRGAVELAAGDFTCSKTIAMHTSGVVLRGAGSGAGGTTLHMTGGRHVAVMIGGGRNPGTPAVGADVRGGASGAASGARTTIADAYVPAGARTFGVADAGGFAVGDMIDIRRPTTPAWVHFMGMDTLTRDGRRQTWIAATRSEVSQRRIAAIGGNTITVDVPLPDSYDAKYLDPPGVGVIKVKDDAGRVTHAGVERLHIECPAIESSYGQHPYSALRIGGDDCWARDIHCDQTMNATVEAGRRITVENVRVTHTYPNLGASKPADFSIEGSQILVDRCSSSGGNTYWVWTGSLEPGPNVVLNSVFRGHGSRIQPHQRWSTALLVDNCAAPDGGIDFMNRGVAGSGHGWTMGWAVAWNCVAKTYVIQQPPGVMNWAIGCIGERVKTARLFDSEPVLAEGTFDSYGAPVAPASLYLAQLRERLGDSALRAIGYGADDAGEFAAARDTAPLPPLPEHIDPELGRDLAVHRPVNAGSEGSPEHRAEMALDADEKTYWSPKEGGRMTLEVDMEGPVVIDALSLSEAAGMAGRVLGYTIDAQVDSDWKRLAEGTRVGGRRVERFGPVTAWKVRLTITKSDGAPAISTLGLYRMPDGKR